MADRPLGFPRAKRLRQNGEFERVYQQNIYAADLVLVVQGCRNNGRITRLGLSVSRRTGNSVIRNRWKRLIREAFRTQQSHLPAGLDLVVRPRKGAQPAFADIRRSLLHLARRVDRSLSHRRMP